MKKNKKGLLVILSAPSGCGKDTVFQELRKVRNDVVESVSATTRAPRDGEEEGINYYFKSESDFQLIMLNDVNSRNFDCSQNCHVLTKSYLCNVGMRDTAQALGNTKM